VAAPAAASSLAADRYAQALYDLAVENGAADAVGADLEQLTQLAASSPELGALVRSPVVARDAQAKAIGEVLAQGEAHWLTRNFVQLTAKNRRLNLLPAITRSYGAIAAKARGEIAAEVTTAYALSETQIADLKGQLKAAYGRDPKLTIWIDPSLIAGLVVKVGSTMVDSSLKTKLASLKSVLKGA
jgi:F-type H+-transporting ATPase subunit delta